MLLEVLLGRSDELDGGKLVAERGVLGAGLNGWRGQAERSNIPPVLEAADDWADQATLEAKSVIARET